MSRARWPWMAYQRLRLQVLFCCCIRGSYRQRSWLLVQDGRQGEFNGLGGIRFAHQEEDRDEQEEGQGGRVSWAEGHGGLEQEPRHGVPRERVRNPVEKVLQDFGGEGKHDLGDDEEDDGGDEARQDRLKRIL
jgi:hypothetical protein